VGVQTQSAAPATTNQQIVQPHKRKVNPSNH
jgi:hypothetical protein